MICNNGPKSVVLRSSDGKEGMKSNVQCHALFILQGRLGAVCHGYYLLTYLLTAWSCCYLEHGHGLEGDSFVVSSATSTQLGLLESGVDRQETKALILTNNGLKNLVEVHFVGKKGRLTTVSEPYRGTLCRKDAASLIL